MTNFFDEIRRELIFQVENNTGKTVADSDTNGDEIQKTVEQIEEVLRQLVFNTVENYLEVNKPNLQFEED
jgi:hypothetical protein